jgi:sarcosine/dimethylglycine N-methyltransferase
LCFLHIADRQKLFGVCRRALVPGKYIYIEDYALRRNLTAAEREALSIKVQCPYLPSTDEYVADLNAAGFANVEHIDVTEDWTNFTASRLAAYRSAHARNVTLHGEALVNGLDDFYATVAELFASGAIAGLKIKAR